MMQSILVTGIMGTGKSTVGQALSERLGYTFIAEPVEEYTHFGNDFDNQIDIGTKIAARLTGNHSNCVVDCSVLQSVMMFAREADQRELLRRLPQQEFTYHVALRGDSRVILDRIKLRGRAHEQTLEYFQIEVFQRKYTQFLHYSNPSVIIDTSYLSAQQIVDLIVAHVNK